jgi:hypothetical protein
MTIRRALHRVDGQLKLENVKTEGSVAILALSRPLVAILVNHRRRQIEERLAAGSFWRDTDLVFTTAQGGSIEPRNVGPAKPKPHSFTTLDTALTTDDTVVLKYGVPGSCNACPDMTFTIVRFQWRRRRACRDRQFKPSTGWRLRSASSSTRLMGGTI